MTKIIVSSSKIWLLKCGARSHAWNWSMFADIIIYVHIIFSYTYNNDSWAFMEMVNNDDSNPRPGKHPFLGDDWSEWRGTPRQWRSRLRSRRTCREAPLWLGMEREEEDDKGRRSMLCRRRSRRDSSEDFLMYPWESVHAYMNDRHSATYSSILFAYATIIVPVERAVSCRKASSAQVENRWKWADAQFSATRRLVWA